LTAGLLRGSSSLYAILSALRALSGYHTGFEPGKDAALFASLILNVEIWSVVIDLLGVINPPPKGEDRRLFLGKGIWKLDVAFRRESASRLDLAFRRLA
jgi:hypothetical protein